MWKAFLLPLTVSLLASFGAAAAIVDVQTLSHPIQARRLYCNKFFGQGIHSGDCAMALEEIGRMPVTSIDPATGDTVIYKEKFGRGMSDPLFRMPKSFVFGTCAIIIDMTEPRASMTSTWTFAGLGAHDLVTNCVLTTGQGGMLNTNGFDTVLFNPSDINEQTRRLWERCTDLIDDFGQSTKPKVETPCIPPGIDAAAASMRAGFGRSGSTANLDPSVPVKAEQ